jgi:ABC-type dipeptide/oligopeptide/nickel transport system ATPase component
MDDALLQVDDLTVDFFTFERALRVLDGVSLTVRRREMMGVVGETGSGKTVLQRAIIDLLPRSGRITGGRVLFKGRDLVGLADGEFRKLRGNEISLIPAQAREALNPVLPVGIQIANVIRAHSELSKKEGNRRAVELIGSVAIPDPEARAQAYPHELSAGMVQRILIAMAIANSPSLILADEPTSSLDVTIQLQVLGTFSTLVKDQGSAALIVTRDLGIVAQFCQRLAVMRHGLIYEMAPVDEFFRDPRHPYSRALVTATQASRGEIMMSEETRALLGGDSGRASKDDSVAATLKQVGRDHFVRL